MICLRHALKMLKERKRERVINDRVHLITKTQQKWVSMISLKELKVGAENGREKKE